jgi:hypothetical protein
MKNNITPSQSAQNTLFVIPVLIIVILFYVWLSSSGGGQNGTTTHYYADLADAFLNGNLHLATKPDPRLLAAKNPYNLQARIELVRDGVEIPVDLSLYHGKFYMYWGPVPALFLAAFQSFSQRLPIGDFFLAFAFAVGIFLTQSLLLLALWDRQFRQLPKWILSLSILVGGFILPVALLRHEHDYARIYEASIAGGQFFLIGGLFMAFTAISGPSISNTRLAGAGFVWALAIGSRHILVVPIGFVVILLTIWTVRKSTGLMAKVTNLVSLYLPLALGGAGLAWYNWARFGSITETGFSYALAGIDLQEHSAEVFSNAYIFQNVYNYLLRPPGFLSTFPFIEMLKGSENTILPFYEVPKFYYAQSLTGLLYLFPFAIFAIVSLIAFFREPVQEKSAVSSLDPGDHQLLVWMTLQLGGSILIAFFLLTLYFWAGIRYLGDFISPLTVLSALGFWQGYRFSSRKLFMKNVYIFCGVVLAGISILTSIFLAISTNSALTDLILQHFPFLK